MNLKEKLKYIYHSDIETLEIFQSCLLIFVNPINLYYLDCHKHNIKNYLLGLGISCMITGILNFLSLLNDNLKQRLDIARLHLVLTLTICMFLMHCNSIYINVSLIIYYWVQTITCFFVASRLYLEVKHNQKVKHGK